MEIGQMAAKVNLTTGPIQAGWSVNLGDGRLAVAVDRGKRTFRPASEQVREGDAAIAYSVAGH